MWQRRLAPGGGRATAEQVLRRGKMAASAARGDARVSYARCGGAPGGQLRRRRHRTPRLGGRVVLGGGGWCREDRSKYARAMLRGTPGHAGGAGEAFASVRAATLAVCAQRRSLKRGVTC